MTILAEFTVAYATLMTEHGPELSMVDLAIARATTREQAPRRWVLQEMRVARRQVNHG